MKSAAMVGLALVGAMSVSVQAGAAPAGTVKKSVGKPASGPVSTTPPGPAAGYRFEAQPRPAFGGGALKETGDPRLAMHASRLLYTLATYTTEGKKRLGLFCSHDGGDHFDPPVPVSEPGATVKGHGESSPSMAFHRGAVFALWEQEREDKAGSDLLFSRSLMMGRAFDRPVRVTDKATPSSNSFSTLAVAPNGDLYAAWLDGRDRQGGRGGTTSAYLARSTDRGATWSKNVRVGTEVCPCCRPSIGFGSQGEVFVSWRHVFAGDIRDMVVATSKDSGATWGEPVRVAVDGWKIEGCPHTGAAMALRGSRVFITWYSEGTGANPGVRLAWSDDGCRTFSKPQIVSGTVVDPNHPVLSVSDDGRVVLAFQGRDPVKQEGWGPLGTYVVDISEGGTTSRPQLVPGSAKAASYPTVLPASLGRLFVAWTEHHGDSSRVMLARARRVGSPAR